MEARSKWWNIQLFTSGLHWKPRYYRGNRCFSSEVPEPENVSVKETGLGAQFLLYYCMKFIIGRKVKMSQEYRPDGRIVPVTVISAEPCVVTQVKSSATDGYEAVQVATGTRRKLPQALLGHFKGLGNFRTVREFRPVSGDVVPNVEVGAKLDVTQFAVGDIVKVTGTTKGRGFQGVVKRWGFSGSPKTHGHKDQIRMPGSIGAGGVQHVFKGTRMGGRMGGKTGTALNLEVIAVRPEKNELVVKGAVPGAPTGILEIIA